jgi:hypothetical protein
MIPHYADNKERRIVEKMARAKSVAGGYDPDEVIHAGKPNEHLRWHCYEFSSLAQYRAWQAMWDELSQGDEVVESGANSHPDGVIYAVAVTPDFRDAAKPIIAKLEKHEDRLVARRSMLGSDDEEFLITAGEARALRAIVNPQSVRDR